MASPYNKIVMPRRSSTRKANGKGRREDCVGEVEDKELETSEDETGYKGEQTMNSDDDSNDDEDDEGNNDEETAKAMQEEARKRRTGGDAGRPHGKRRRKSSAKGGDRQGKKSSGRAGNGRAVSKDNSVAEKMRQAVDRGNREAGCTNEEAEVGRNNRHLEEFVTVSQEMGAMSSVSEDNIAMNGSIKKCFRYKKFFTHEAELRADGRTAKWFYKEMRIGGSDGEKEAWWRTQRPHVRYKFGQIRAAISTGIKKAVISKYRNG